MREIILSFFFILSYLVSYSQVFKNRFTEIDVQNYDISISLNDSNNIVTVSEKVTILFLKSIDSFYVDLVDQDDEKQGMKIHQLLEQDKNIQFAHSNSKITFFPSNIKSNEVRVYQIVYSGIPKDGLVISENKFGDRTFFGDNWPNRAKNWIACVDHPSDKATVSWQVEVPDHYKVIANGELKFEVDLPNNRKAVNYSCSQAIPTKVMVIGAAKFEVEQSGIVQNIPVSSWVYPQDKVQGFYDYKIATEVLGYFIEHFGPYPYVKLANVQSTTRFGGMENASCVFYDESKIDGKRSSETLIAHELAHQWFGNSATEMDWPHLWLSEGFATYCTNLYIEEKYGLIALNKQLEKDRQKVIRYHKKNPNPVIDTISTDLMVLLNPNSYQKGAWILHMLRRKIGDDLFWKGMNAYYDKFKLSNATTDDFITVMEETSSLELSSFFYQWLNQSGHPSLKVDHKLNKKSIEIEVHQVQKTNIIFSFPLEIKLIYSDKSSEIMTIEVNKLYENFVFNITSKVEKIILDPETNLLFEQVNETY